MKIGIMTFWWSEDNYGQLLQCYALQKYLRDKGHDAFLIRYYPYGDVIKTPLFIKIIKAITLIKLCTYISKKFKKNRLQKEIKRNPRYFESFRKKYIKQSDKIYYSINELKENAPTADMYIVGSDQVWNFGYTKVRNIRNVIHAYFLDFGPDEIKRIAYAASWSMSSITNELIVEIAPLLQKFDFVSVREKKGIELCRQCGYENTQCVVDPTILLEPGVYRKLYKENNIRKQSKKYVLLYILNNTHKFDIRKAYDYAAKKNLDVVYVTGNGVVDKKEKHFATIPEWLYLVDNAEYVITNSFHCTVFSIIFHKQFAVIPLSGKITGMNERMLTLFQQFSIRERFINNHSLAVLDLEYIPVNIDEQFTLELFQ